MEDPEPESEWEIQEYCPSSKPGYGSSSMVKWMLNRGFVIGKNLVITGLAISSAPLVVPPLVVFSAMGYAFYFPVGFVFASYTFTNKLLSTLLPSPSPPPPLMLEYYHTYDQYDKDKDEAIELDDGGGVDDDYDQIHLLESEDGYNQQYVGGSITNEDDNVDEKVQIISDNNKEGEVLITKMDTINVDADSYINENVLEDNEKEGHLIQKENAIEEGESEKMEDVKQGAKTGLGLDVACDKHKTTEQISSVTDFGVSVDDKGYEEDVGEYLEGADGSLEEPLIDVNKIKIQDVFEDEKEEIAKGSTGLLEKIRDEERVDNVVEDENLLSEKASNLDDDGVKDFEAKEPVMVNEISSQKLVDGSSNDEIVGEMRHVVILSGGNEENNFNSRELEERDLVASEVMGHTNRKARSTESDEKVMRESMGTQEKTDGNVYYDGSEDDILRTKKELLIHINSDGREIDDESGLDLVDERVTNIDLKNLEDGDEAKEDTTDENVDVVGPPTFTRAPLATDDAKAASKTKTNKKMPSREDILDDEKIWEKIRAMRTIVGYNAPSQATCIEELKALYVFTGVEPPAAGWFKTDSDDLDEVNAKLKFLMAIVGVK